MTDIDMNEDAVTACVGLVDRAGASGFEIGCAREGVPSEDAGWYAFATYQGARIMTQEHRSPTTAAMALAERLLRGALCRCGDLVTLSSARPGCRWRLVGPRWEPGCDTEPVPIDAPRGDLAAIRRAMTEPANRAERRRRKK